MGVNEIYLNFRTGVSGSSLWLPDTPEEVYQRYDVSIQQGPPKSQHRDPGSLQEVQFSVLHNLIHVSYWRLLSHIVDVQILNCVYLLNISRYVCQSLVWLLQENQLHVNPSGDKTRTFWENLVNTMAANVLIRPWAALVLTLNMLNCKCYIHILNRILDLAWPKSMELTQ